MSVHNEDVAAIFDEMADLLEIEAANPFRVRAYRNAARNIRGLDRELAAMLNAGEDLTRLPGIGKDLAAKIREIVGSGHARALDRLHREVPASLAQLLGVPGLGPKRVRAVYETLNIRTLKQLERAARTGRLAELPGFGVKLQQRILEAVRAHAGSDKRFLRSVVRGYAEPLVRYLQQLPGVADVVVAGSYRRACETVGDLDILVTAQAGSAVTEGFVAYEDVADIVSKGRTRATVVLRNALQVDLRVVDQSSLGAALYYFTGSKAHNIAVRRSARRRGLKINEYGVYRGDKRIAGGSEASVLKAVGLAYIAPELRENRGEIEAAKAGTLPALLSRNDIRGDLHAHTRATDGNAALRQMALAARSAGLRYLAITDHSQHLRVAHGLDADALRRQIDAIDRLNDALSDITLLKGIEVDILEDGRLDLPDSVLAELDLVVAAVHSRFRLPSRKQTARILRAMDSHYFSILAHPTGRLLGERDAMALDMPRIIAAAKARGCFLELNSQPQRLDLNAIHCQQAREQGVLVSINSDSHSVGGFELLEAGVAQARRGWLESRDVLNTRPLGRLRKLLAATMG